MSIYCKDMYYGIIEYKCTKDDEYDSLDIFAFTQDPNNLLYKLDLILKRFYFNEPNIKKYNKKSFIIFESPLKSINIKDLNTFVISHKCIEFQLTIDGMKVFGDNNLLDIVKTHDFANGLIKLNNEITKYSTHSKKQLIKIITKNKYPIKTSYRLKIGLLDDLANYRRGIFYYYHSTNN